MPRLSVFTLSIMTSVSLPEEQNKLSTTLTQLLILGLTSKPLHCPETPISSTPWRAGLGACAASGLCRKGRLCRLQQRGKGDPERPWCSRSDPFQHPGWLMAGKSAQREGKEDVLPSPHTVGISRDKSCIWATGCSRCWWAENLSSPYECFGTFWGLHTL